MAAVASCAIAAAPRLARPAPRHSSIPGARCAAGASVPPVVIRRTRRAVAAASIAAFAPAALATPMELAQVSLDIDGPSVAVLVSVVGDSIAFVSGDHHHHHHHHHHHGTKDSSNTLNNGS